MTFVSDVTQAEPITWQLCLTRGVGDIMHQGHANPDALMHGSACSNT